MNLTEQVVDAEKIQNLKNSGCIICGAGSAGIRVLKIEYRNHEPDAAYAPLCENCFDVEAGTVWDAIKMEMVRDEKRIPETG